MSFGGFTEDDQAKIAEEVHGRVRAKRTGLGFGAATPEASSGTRTPSSNNNSSSWFHQREESATQLESSAANHDTTEGAFPWDGGNRGKAGGMARNRDQRGARAVSSAQADNGSPKEREFPMVRDRDIEHSEVRRDGKSQRRTRSRSLDNERRDNERRMRRGRNRSRSRDRERDLRPARRRDERQRDRETPRDRERSRNRSRERDRDTRQRSPYRSARATLGRSSTTRDGHERHPGRHSDRHDRSSGMGVEMNAHNSPPVKEPTAEQAKAAVKRRLRQVVAGDVTLKTGFKAALGGGGGWERAEMSEAAEFFKSDEVAAQGGVASVAPEYQARLAEILAVEDEDTMCLGDGMQKTLAAVDAVSGTTGLDHSARMHHEAIFAPSGSVLSQPTAPVTSAATFPSPADVSSKSILPRRVGTAGAVGAAARARLALTGKLGEASPMKPRSTPTNGGTKTATTKTREHSSTPEDDVNTPLFETLRAAESVEARYTADDKWYAAIVLQVIHGGFDIARYKIRYCEYGNEETLSWKKIRRPEATTRSPPPVLHSVPKLFVSSPDEAPMPSEPDATADGSKPFAGMRPRSLCVDKTDARKEPSVKRDETASQSTTVVVDVVNPDILSVTAGRKLSWKEKLQARKTGASRPVDVADGVRILPKKQICLVPDFAAQRREQEGDNRLDKSEWRSKVAFGMGNSKKTDR